VLEAAVAVAKLGSRAVPPIPAPPGLRPYLAFRRLSGPALDAAMLALDDDAVFRRRVPDTLEAAALQLDDDEEDEGDDDPSAERADLAAALVLERPDGWRADLADLVAAVRAEGEEAELVARARRLSRDLERARSERDTATEDRRVARDARDRAVSEAAELRRSVAALQAELITAKVETETLREERQRAIRDLKATEARFVDRRAELKAARAEVIANAAEIEELRAGGVGAATPVAVPVPPPPSAQPALARDDTTDALDRVAVAEAVRRASDAAAALTSALGDVAAAISGDDTDAIAEDAPPVTRGQQPKSPPRSSRAPRRRPPDLPRGVFDDSPEAADFLCRLPAVVILVDGYNVSLAGWPGLALAEQRRRLLDALGALSARTGCEPLVVFDGADVGAGLPGESRIRGVQVRFTAPDVEADDDLLARIDRMPVARPVVVVSSDRRVADGARTKGAATLSSPQLLQLLR